MKQAGGRPNRRGFNSGMRGERADYLSRIAAEKHAYTAEGPPARRGVEG